jgi:hypothetical protein
MKTALHCLLFMLATATLRSQVIVDSVADHSGTQGSNSWYYGYYDASGDPVAGYDATNDFTLCTIWDGAVWWVSGDVWTSLGTQGGHPNGATNTPGRQLREQWPIRRWVSTVTDTIRIRGHAAKENPQCGDGTTVKLFVNGNLIFDSSIAGDDSTGTNYAVTVMVHTNDLVDFAITSGCCGDVSCDGTFFTGVIEHASITVTAAAAVEVGATTILGQNYQMEHSTDRQTWQPIGPPFSGTGGTIYFLFSIRELGSPGFFRTRVIP